MTRRTTRAGIVPEWLLSLSPAAVKVYAAIDLHADREGLAFPSVRTLASIVGVHEATIRRAVVELEKAGALVREERVREDGSRTSNFYYLRRDPPDWDALNMQGAPRKNARASRARSLSTEVNDRPEGLSRKSLQKARVRNPPFDALIEVTGADPKAEGKKVAKALATIRALYEDEHGSLPQKLTDPALTIFADEIRRRAGLYHRTMPPGTMLTPTALASNWSLVARDVPRARGSEQIADRLLREALEEGK